MTIQESINASANKSRRSNRAVEDKMRKCRFGAFAGLVTKKGFVRKMRPSRVLSLHNDKLLNTNMDITK